MSVVQDVLAGTGVESAPRNGGVVRGTAARALWPGRTPAGIVVAAVLSAVAWTVAAEILAAMAGLSVRPSGLWPPVRRLLSVTFDHPAVPAVAMALIVSGGALVALAVLPGRPRLVPVESGDPLLAMGLTRAGLRRTLAAAVGEVDGVRRARVVLRRNGQVEVVVVTEGGGAADLLREVGAAVGDQLAGLGVRCRGGVVVRLCGRGI